MAKEEWGTKRVCPKCGARFYDLKKEPVTCIECGTEFVPEPVLKSKQPVAAAPVAEKKEKADSEVDDNADDETEGLDLGDDDIEIDDDDDDSVLGDVSLDDDEADLSDVVKKPSDDES